LFLTGGATAARQQVWLPVTERLAAVDLHIIVEHFQKENIEIATREHRLMFIQPDR
jgi:hypothetical protein